VDAELERLPGFDPCYMLDQSHNVTDPIESLMTSAVELSRAYVQAHLVDRQELTELQERNDALMALSTLKRAFTTDVTPILGMARHRAGGAIDPVETFRSSGYRSRKEAERPPRRGAAPASFDHGPRRDDAPAAQRLPSVGPGQSCVRNGDAGSPALLVRSGWRGFSDQA
jgi:L-rhamnose isomerase